MVEINAQESEIVEGNAKVTLFNPLSHAPSTISGSIKNKINLVRCFSFHVIIMNQPYWDLRNREKLIQAVKSYAKGFGLDSNFVKSETITRTWREMVIAGVIPKCFKSDLYEGVYREVYS